MPVFTRGEKVQIVEHEKSSKVYIIKAMKRTRKNGILYLLKSLEEKPIMRLFYEGSEALLERIS